jgi:hypothetical protein
MSMLINKRISRYLFCITLGLVATAAFGGDGSIKWPVTEW